MVLMLLMMSNLTIMMMILMMIKPGKGGTFCWLASQPAVLVDFGGTIEKQKIPFSAPLDYRGPWAGGPIGPQGARWGWRDPPREAETTETTTTTETTNIPTPTTPLAPAPRDEISRSVHQPPHSDHRPP